MLKGLKKFILTGVLVTCVSFQTLASTVTFNVTVDPAIEDYIPGVNVIMYDQINWVMNEGDGEDDIGAYISSSENWTKTKNFIDSEYQVVASVPGDLIGKYRVDFDDGVNRVEFDTGVMNYLTLNGEDKTINLKISKGQNYDVEYNDITMSGVIKEKASEMESIPVIPTEETSLVNDNDLEQANAVMNIIQIITIVGLILLAIGGAACLIIYFRKER